MARYYDSRTGTFCSADPLAGDLSDPQSWNRYPYGRNDPIGITDPSGKSWWSNLLIDVGIGVAMYFAGPEIASFFGADAPAAGYAAGDLPETFTSLPTLQIRVATAAISAGGDAAAGAGGGLAWGLGGAEAAQAAQSTDPSRSPNARMPLAPINVPDRIDQAKKDLSSHCNSVFSQKIRGYTKAGFFKTLSNATINQFPGGTPPQDSDYYGADAVTHPPRGPIDLLPNFYGLSANTQAFVLIHEGIHLFGRGRLGDSTVQRLFGLPVTGNTSNITNYIQGGCNHR